MPSSFGGALPKNPRRRVNQAMRWLQNLHGTMSSSKKGRPSSPNPPPQPQISACEKCGLGQALALQSEHKSREASVFSTPRDTLHHDGRGNHSPFPCVAEKFAPSSSSMSLVLI